MTNKEMIINAFNNVKALGWVESNRKNNTGIGKTFEDYIGVVENNLDEPDLYGFEIKSHREMSASYVTLFTKSPSFPPKANSLLKDKFGENYENSTMKKLHTSMFANSFNSFINKYSFKLIHSLNEKRIYIGVFSIGGKLLIDKSAYYTYEHIEKALLQKLKNLFFVTAKTNKGQNGKELFNFDSAEIYTNPSLERFLEMLDSGEIMYDIRIGFYQSGKNIGKPHDHGSGFRIKEENISKLYSTIEKI